MEPAGLALQHISISNLLDSFADENSSLQIFDQAAEQGNRARTCYGEHPSGLFLTLQILEPMKV